MSTQTIVSYEVWGYDVQGEKDILIFTKTYTEDDARQQYWKATLGGDKYLKNVRVVKETKIITTEKTKTILDMPPITEEEAAQYEENELWFDGGS